MLKWEQEEIESDNGQIGTRNKIILMSTEAILRDLNALLVIIRSRYIPGDRLVGFPDERVIKNLCWAFKELLDYLRLTLNPRLLCVKLMEKRPVPLRTAGFYNTCKLNLRNAP